MSADTGDRVTRVYGGFRGADFRGDEVNLSRSPDCLNVWRDYKKTESISTRPALTLEHNFTDTVYDIWFFKDQMIVHSGAEIFALKNGVKTDITPQHSGGKIKFPRKPMIGFVWGNTSGVGNYFYIISAVGMYRYDGTDIFGSFVGYTPTTSIGRKPSGGGTVYEDVNLFNSQRINTFIGDGRSAKYYLDATELDEKVYPKVKVDGKEIPRIWKEGTEFNGVMNHNVDLLIWDYNAKNGTVEFFPQATSSDGMYAYIPPAPRTDGQDNVSIQFQKTVVADKTKLFNCTMHQVFDNRVFISGNPDYPNRMWHCGLDDPTYWSDLDYYDDGRGDAKITGLVSGNNALWVFREPSDMGDSIFYHEPTIDNDYGKIYPSQHSNVGIGCVGKAVNFNDDIVFFSPNGMEGINSDVTTEQVAAHRSTLVDRKLLADENYKDMLLAEWEGYLLVFCGNRVYLADSRAMFSNEGHVEYEWFYWEMGQVVTAVAAHDGDLYVGTAFGVYKFAEIDYKFSDLIPISYWTTPKDKFNAPQKLKTTNKRGCVIEATGQVRVTVKTENSGFEEIGEYHNVTDHIVCRIKRKKWKDIQLRFASSYTFTIESATLEAFVGGYIKR